MKTLSYPATFETDETGAIVVSFPDLKGANTSGADEVEALEEATDCLGSALAFLIADKADIPAASRAKAGQRKIPVPLWIAGKLALYRAMREQGVNNSQLARRLGLTETVVRRMLDPDHDTKSEKIQAALAALGKRVVVAVEDAA